MSGANANALIGLFGEQLAPRVNAFRQYIRQAPFAAFRMNVLLILGTLGNPERAALRTPVLDILENAFDFGRALQQGELIHRQRQRVVAVLQALLNHPDHPQLGRAMEIMHTVFVQPNHPHRNAVVGLLHALFVRDNYLGGLPPNDSMISRFMNIMHRMLHDNQLPDETRLHLIHILQRILRPDDAVPQEYNDAYLMRLRYITMTLDTVLNHHIILQQPNRAVQAQLVHRLFGMVVNVNNNDPQLNERFELLLLMVRLLVNPDGFNDVLRNRMHLLLNQVQQDAAGHAFIENFENILMEIIAGDEDEEPSSMSGYSQQTQGNDEPPAQRRRLNQSPQSSSAQSREPQLEAALMETAQSNPPRGGKGKKPVAKPVAKQAKPAKKK